MLELLEKISVVVTPCDIEKALDYLSSPLDSCVVVSFLNAHSFLEAQRDAELNQCLLESRLLLRDGIGVATLMALAGRTCGKNMNGTDFIPKLIKRFENRKVALLGTREPYLTRAAEFLKGRGANIVLSIDGFQPEDAYASKLISTDVELIVLGMGVPKQEKVAAILLKRLDKPAVIVNGGAILDFVAGRFPWAPILMRKLGLEWFFRLLLEPRRLWRRYFGALQDYSVMAWRVFLARTRHSKIGTAPTPAISFHDSNGPANPTIRRKLVVCLAASGGGHIRQLLDLEKAWTQHEYYFVTEDTGLSRSLALRHPVFFVAHVAFGQAKLGRPFHMLAVGAKNFIQSAKIVIHKRPDVVVSTGAGAAFFTVLWARLLGARIVTIESFARFDKPSLYGRLAAPFAHDSVIQSAKLANYFPKARVFDPLRILDTPRPLKKPLLFATVGATLPFDRLVRAVETLKKNGTISEQVVIQTGVGGYIPEDIETFETLPFETMKSYLRDADIVVCHGGTGSLITALRQGCRVIVMPRLYELGEHYDHHQRQITDAFAERGLVLKANTLAELQNAILESRERTPVTATTDASDLTNFLDDLLSEVVQDQNRLALYYTSSDN